LTKLADGKQILRSRNLAWINQAAIYIARQPSMVCAINVNLVLTITG